MSKWLSPILGLLVAYLTSRYVLPVLRTSYSANKRSPGETTMGWLASSTNRYARMSAVHAAKKLEVVPGESVIEIGPGVGEALVAFLEKEPSRLIAFELSPLYCGQLKGMANLQVDAVEIRCDDARVMSGVQDASIDKVFGMDVVYFLDPLEEYLAEIYRVLKPGGLILFGFKDLSDAINERDAVNRHEDRIVDKLKRVGFEAFWENTPVRKFGKRRHQGDYLSIIGTKPNSNEEKCDTATVTASP